MALIDHVSPREHVRTLLRDQLRELTEAAIQKIDVDAPLDPEHPGELDPGGEPAKLWQNVPVITVKDLEAAFSAVFGEPLPAPSEKTAEVATPATVFVSAECPRCHLPARVPLAVTVELHQDDQGETLHLKPKSKETIHVCGQLALPDPEETEQADFGLDDITGPVPTAEGIDQALAGLAAAEIERSAPAFQGRPELAVIEAWSELAKREVLAWAQALHQSSEDAEVIVPPLPEVLGGAPAQVDETEEEADSEETDPAAERCPFPNCPLPIDHKGPHDAAPGDPVPA